MLDEENFELFNNDTSKQVMERTIERLLSVIKDMEFYYSIPVKPGVLGTIVANPVISGENGFSKNYYADKFYINVAPESSRIMFDLKGFLDMKRIPSENINKKVVTKISTGPQPPGNFPVGTGTETETKTETKTETRTGTESQLTPEQQADAKKAERIISASFTGQGTTFEIEIRGEKRDFLLTWDRNNTNPTLWGNKTEYGTYTTTDEFPSKEDVQRLVDKYIPSKLLNLINEWTNASKLPAGKVLEAQAIAEAKINAELAALKNIKQQAETETETDTDLESLLKNIDELFDHEEMAEVHTLIVDILQANSSLLETFMVSVGMLLEEEYQNTTDIKPTYNYRFRKIMENIGITFNEYDKTSAQNVAVTLGLSKDTQKEAIKNIARKINNLTKKEC